MLRAQQANRDIPQRYASVLFVVKQIGKERSGGEWSERLPATDIKRQTAQTASDNQTASDSIRQHRRPPRTGDPNPWTSDTMLCVTLSQRLP